MLLVVWWSAAKQVYQSRVTFVTAGGQDPSWRTRPSMNGQSTRRMMRGTGRYSATATTSGRNGKDPLK